MPANDLLEMSVVDLAAAIRKRNLSPVEAVEAHIARIEAVNPPLNALVAERYDLARDEARRAESQLAAAGSVDELPPLHGVPCTIKEFIGVGGMPHTAGLMARKGMVARADSAVVERLRRAGAIVLGVTNAPEGGMWMETHNKIYGRTNNPWDLKRTPGGSSGGEAALIACGASPFGIGSDIAGSIRIPSAFCGVVGHKPTGRLVPNTGHWGSEGGTSPFLVCGPIARRVCDLELILGLITGPDGVDPNTRAWDLGKRKAGDLDGVVVYPVESNGITPVSESMRREIRRAAAALEARGATIRPLDSVLLRWALMIWAVGMSEANADAASFSALLGEGTELPLGREVARTFIGRSSVTFPALALAVIDKLSSKLPRRLAAGSPRPADLRDELEGILGPNGVMLHPPFTRPAPRHVTPLLTPLHFICTGIFSVIEFPVTQVPTGFERRGLPVGVQVAARRGNDRLTLAVAAALEEEFGGWVRAEPRKRGWFGR